jgi:hypothetical protein
LRLALQFLGHEAPRLDFADTLLWAIEHWCLDHIPRTSIQAIDTLK